LRQLVVHAEDKGVGEKGIYVLSHSCSILESSGATHHVGRGRFVGFYLNFGKSQSIFCEISCRRG
jgi:hypothetical protein